MFVTATLLVMYKGPHLFLSRQGIITLTVIAISSFCILLGDLSEFDTKYRLIPLWTPLFTALVVGFTLFYSVVMIILCLKIQNNLSSIIKRKFNRFFIGVIPLLLGYWIIILYMNWVIPFNFRIFSVPLMVIGGILMYQGLIRSPKEASVTKAQ